MKGFKDFVLEHDMAKNRKSFYTHIIFKDRIYNLPVHLKVRPVNRFFVGF